MINSQRDPIFIAKFENGHETCTAVFCPPDKLAPARGIELARAAFTRLMKRPPPPIASARFEFNGEVLASYSAAELAALSHNKEGAR